MGRSLQMDSSVGDLLYPSSGAANIQKQISSKYPEVPEIQKRHPFHFPLQKWFIQTKIKNVLKVHTLNAHPLCPSPENLGKGPYLHSLLAKFLQPLKPSLPFREYGFVPHTAGSCNGFSLLSRNDSRKTTK